MQIRSRLCLFQARESVYALVYKADTRLGFAVKIFHMYALLLYRAGTRLCFAVKIFIGSSTDKRRPKRRRPLQQPAFEPYTRGDMRTFFPSHAKRSVEIRPTKPGQVITTPQTTGWNQETTRSFVTTINLDDGGLVDMYAQIVPSPAWQDFGKDGTRTKQRCDYCTGLDTTYLIPCFWDIKGSIKTATC